MKDFCGPTRVVLLKFTKAEVSSIWNSRSKRDLLNLNQYKIKSEGNQNPHSKTKISLCLMEKLKLKYPNCLQWKIRNGFYASVVLRGSRLVTSQLAIMNTPCAFYFYMVFLKNRNIWSTFLRKQTLLPRYLACENLPFSCTAH